MNFKAYRRPASRNVQIALAVFSLLLVFVPMLCVIPYIFMAEDFTPTSNLKPMADFVSIAGAVGFIALIWPSQVDEIRASWTDGKVKALLYGIALFAFTPLFGWALLQAFFAGPLSYGLHRLSGPGVSIQEFPVARADDFGGRKCRNRVILEDGPLFWQRVVCGLPSDAVDKLRGGGRLRIEGTFSQYGLQRSRYQIVGDA
jgi:hypothetical protein